MGGIQLILSALQIANSATGYLIARRGGDTSGALAILAAINPASFGLDGDAAAAVNLAKAGLAFLETRGVTRTEAFVIITKARAQGRDITLAEIDSALASVDASLDTLKAAIDRAKAAGH